MLENLHKVGSFPRSRFVASMVPPAMPSGIENGDDVYTKAELLQKLKDVQEDCVNLELQNVDLELEVEKLAGDKTQLTKQLKEKDALIAKLKEDLAYEKKMHDEFCSTTVKELEEQKAMYDDLKGKFHREEITTDQLEQKNRLLEDAKDEMQKQCEEQLDRIAQLEVVQQDAEEKIRALAEECADNQVHQANHPPALNYSDSVRAFKIVSDLLQMIENFEKET